MAAFQLLQHLVPWLGNIDSWHSLTHHALLWHSSIDGSVLAALLETDVFKPVRLFFDYFIKSGQIWALLIGSVVGYLFRSLTSYG